MVFDPARYLFWDGYKNQLCARKPMAISPQTNFTGDGEWSRKKMIVKVMD